MYSLPGPSPGFSSRWGQKTRRRGLKPEEGAHFKNTVLDVCSNQGANREMGGTDLKWGAAPLAPPLATALQFTLTMYHKTALVLLSFFTGIHG